MKRWVRGIRVYYGQVGGFCVWDVFDYVDSVVIFGYYWVGGFG